MTKKLLLSVQKRWKAVGKYKHPNGDLLELEIYKNILKYFQLGDFYYFTFLPSISQIEMVSDSMSEMLGYTAQEFDIEKMINSIHPDDLPNFINFEHTVVDFKLNLPPDKILKYKSRYNYRIRKKDRQYIHIMQQSTTIQCDAEGAVIRNLVVHTDITNLKKDFKMELSFIGLDGEPSFHNVEVVKKHYKKDNLLTRRELEILELLGQNLTSIEIGEALDISCETVKTHRKNIHVKTGTSNVLELVLLGKKKGWI